MFPVSVWTGYYVGTPVREALQKLRNAGFRYGELDVSHTQKLMEEGDPSVVGAKIKEYTQSIDYTLLQGHLRFDLRMAEKSTVDVLKRELELYQAIGIKSAVLHFTRSDDPQPPEETYAARVENVRALAEFLKGSDTYICLENLCTVPAVRTIEGILKVREDAGKDHIGVCLDTGHLHMANGLGLVQQTQREFILAAGENLRAMHVAENNGKSDDHQMPYSARFGVKWDEVVTAIKEIDYKGLFNLELLGERLAPDAIKTSKLHYIKEMTDYMLAD